MGGSPLLFSRQGTGDLFQVARRGRAIQRFKAVLLERYGLTSQGYRRKLGHVSPEPDESPSQFLSRIESYQWKMVLIYLSIVYHLLYLSSSYLQSIQDGLNCPGMKRRTKGLLTSLWRNSFWNAAITLSRSTGESSRRFWGPF